MALVEAGWLGAGFGWSPVVQGSCRKDLAGASLLPIYSPMAMFGHRAAWPQGPGSTPPVTPTATGDEGGVMGAWRGKAADGLRILVATAGRRCMDGGVMRA